MSKIATLKGAQKDDVLIFIGDTTGQFGASLFAREWLGLKGEALGSPPPIDLGIEKTHAAFVRQLIHDGLVHAVHDISDGGIACAAAELALASGIGMTVSIEDIGPGKAASLNLFCEASARYLIAVPQSSQSEIVRRGNELSINAGWCGSVKGDSLVFIEEPVKARTVAELPLSHLRDAHEGWLPNYMNEVD